LEDSMHDFADVAEIDEAVETIRLTTGLNPDIGLILGSGLGELADMVEGPQIISVEDIPNWPLSTVSGHKGRLVLGKLAGQDVMIQQGRVHYYEGYTMAQVTFSVRVMQRMKFRALVVTNAAGGINSDFSAGDLMLITDHIGFLTMSGLSPLRGPNLNEFGVRFPDMSHAYDRRWVATARQVAREKVIDLKEGVYAGLGGPSYETPAELRFLKAVGADAVGMSTVPEVVVANHGRLPVLGFSSITNKVSLDGSSETTHEEVLQAGELIIPKLKSMILGCLQKLSEEDFLSKSQA
jgi:purine-nucleoside phosphorylase